MPTLDIVERNVGTGGLCPRRGRSTAHAITMHPCKDDAGRLLARSASAIKRQTTSAHQIPNQSDGAHRRRNPERMTATVIGVLAAALSVSSFLPQAWRVIKTRQTKDLATPMWIMNVTAFALWTVYGAIIHAWPIIVPNVICCLLAAFILTMKLVSKPTKERVADAIMATGPSQHGE
jgi:MtN3 and saliva related transmembrane protein